MCRKEGRFRWQQYLCFSAFSRSEILVPKLLFGNALAGKLCLAKHGTRETGVWERGRSALPCCLFDLLTLPVFPGG